jgi:ABC-type branched-subunit amino acid transport system substrate-binding protein
MSLAVSEINKHGGVLGRQLAITNVDDKSDPAVALSAAHSLVDAGATVILGAECSGMTQAIEDGLTNAGHIVLISGSATAVPLTDATHNSNGYFFRTVPSDALQGKLLAELARDAGMAQVSVLYDPGIYGDGLSNQFVQTFTGLGGSATRTSYQVNQTAAQYGALFPADYPSGKDGGVLLAGYIQDGVNILTASLNSPPATPVTWMFTDALADSQLYTGVGASGFGTLHYFGTAPDVPQGAAETTFQAAFTAKYGTAPTPNFFDENWYDATYMVALAIEAAGSTSADAIKAKIPAVINGPGTSYPPTGFAAAVADLKAGKGIQYQGVTGLTGMAATGDLTSGAFNVWSFDSSGNPLPNQTNIRP